MAGLDFRIIPAGLNAPLEFLTGLTPPIRDSFKERWVALGVAMSRPDQK
jgi:hypothetical protein